MNFHEIHTQYSPEPIPEWPTGTCLLAYRGSIAHNMYVPKNDPNSIDDIDLIGIVLAPVECYLGLTEWGSRGTKELKQGQWDIVYYELKKAISLLLQGNPNIMSLLWLRPDHYISRDGYGMDLVRNRSLFVGKHVYNAFAGYAYAQLQKMESRDPAELREYVAVTNELKYRGAHPNHKGEKFPRPISEVVDVGPNTGTSPGPTGDEINAFKTSTDKLLARLSHFQKKGENLGYMGDKRKQLVIENGYYCKNAAHCIRLLRMAKEFLLTGEMTVYRKADREELLDIKKGKWPIEQVKELAEQLFVEVKEARDKSPLPEKPNREAVEDLLVDMLREHIDG